MCLSVCLSRTCVCAHARAHVQVRGQFCGVGSFLSSYTGLWLNRNQQALLPSKPSYQILDRLLTSIDIPTLRRLEQKKIEFEVNMSYTKTWRNIKILSPEWRNEWMNVFSPWMNKLPLVNLMKFSSLTLLPIRIIAPLYSWSTQRLYQVCTCYSTFEVFLQLNQ